MDSIGERLREERDRLGRSQADLASVGGVGRRAQTYYESGERSPDAAYLGRVAEIGIDVQYVITGVRSSSALTPDERVLMERYRASATPLRDAALRVLLGGAEPTEKKKVKITGGRHAGRDFKEITVAGDFVEKHKATPTKQRRTGDENK